ncbi:MAG: oligopeptide/dipeptide ABC transporter ATP-binding protein [Geminicoccales bacterium]
MFDHPRHPYTNGLLGAIPRLAGGRDRLATISGAVPEPGSMPGGCRFAPRCGRALDRCAREEPPLDPSHDRHHAAACWNPA